MSEKSKESGDLMETRPEKTAPLRSAEGPYLEEGPTRSHSSRVETIRDLLDSGSYDIPPMAIAERMLDRMAHPPRRRDQ